MMTINGTSTDFSPVIFLAAAGFQQLVECFFSAGCFSEDAFDPSLARKCPFVFTVDDLESIWQPRNPMRIYPWSGDSEAYLYHTTILDEVSFITQDPGRQYISGSFHPQDIDWFRDAYYPPGIIEDPEAEAKKTAAVAQANDRARRSV